MKTNIIVNWVVVFGGISYNARKQIEFDEEKRRTSKTNDEIVLCACIFGTNRNVHGDRCVLLNIKQY